MDNTELNFIFLLLIVILVVSIIKKEYLTIFMISGILYCTLFHHLGIDTPLNTIQKIVNENP
ncbi:beta-carotene 15,15'-monooxygenase, partial [Enterococcus faecalis]